METLAYVGGSRWRIETEFETEKSDVGLDEYETRTWAGWHHHVALCLLGGAFLLSLQQAWGEKDAGRWLEWLSGQTSREQFHKLLPHRHLASRADQTGSSGKTSHLESCHEFLAHLYRVSNGVK